ncbi:hypothetical protein E2C01_031995 [Portunus trituberculatus]|uniref:Uncharacterized protein n=1 Tax=Portunus trituberculatus TaxID=210409 RepID=A0A5B7EZR1_PORTR|nr:hypothetical protein [Portunus trituberculatus]
MTKEDKAGVLIGSPPSRQTHVGRASVARRVEAAARSEWEEIYCLPSREDKQYQTPFCECALPPYKSVRGKVSPATLSLDRMIANIPLSLSPCARVAVGDP